MRCRSSTPRRRDLPAWRAARVFSYIANTYCYFRSEILAKENGGFCQEENEFTIPYWPRKCILILSKWLGGTQPG
jgi:hypothetical protein